MKCCKMLLVRNSEISFTGNIGLPDGSKGQVELMSSLTAQILETNTVKNRPST